MKIDISKKSATLVVLLFSLMMALTCIYEPEPFIPQRVTVYVIPVGNGRIDGIRDTVIRKDTVITIQAIPDEGYFFAGWSLPEKKFANPLTITVTGNIVISATFLKNPDGMILVHSRGKSFTMGSGDPLVPEDERPAHQVYFDYNFYLSPNEVTVGEYRSIVPAYNATSHDSIPVTMVTWYDAILFCNALSKREGYDTVYTYKSICSNNLACPFILEDWEIHYDRAGYRLATEAEWEYTCRAGTSAEQWWGTEPADSFVWYFVNSSDTAHVIASKKVNPWGFYDMAGNVAEWVNDWFAFYTPGIDSNPVGPTGLLSEKYESTHQRPIRGGSFRLGSSFLRTTSRRGPYETGAFFSQKDIGFRVAFGAFEANRSRSDTNGQTPVNDSVAVTINATKTDLINFIGTSSVKCAFVNVNQMNRNLYVVDYTTAGTSLFRCGTDSSVYNPVISPDGKYVAYSSMNEGFSGTCTLTIRPTDSDTSSTRIMKLPGILPRWWVSPEGADTFLIYSTGASLNSLPRWHSEQTFKVKMSGGKAIGTPMILWAGGSYHGGLSADGRFLATGYPTARLVDMQINDTNVFYFWPPHSGRDDTAQVCNVSMSPSLEEPGEILLLDFGYPRVSTVTGTSYGFHEIIFVCNSNLMNEKHLSKWFRVPSQFTQWDYPEWSNHPNFIAALALSNDCKVIQIIDYGKGVYQPLLSGEKVREMHLWINPEELPLVNDPYRYFGRYDLPVQSNGQIMLSKKLHTFWRYRDEWEVAILGSSTAYYGFDPEAMSRRAINMGCFGSSINTATVVAECYFLPHSPKLKAIVVDLMSYSFDVDDKRKNPRLSGLLDSKGFELDSSQRFYRNGLPPEIVAKIESWGPIQWNGFDSSGFHFEVKGTGWGRAIIDMGDYDFEDTIVQRNILVLKNMAHLAASKQIHVLVVNTPQHPEYKTSDNMGRLGPSVKTYKKLESVLTDFENENPFFHYYDANNFGDHDYTNEDAFDANHLSTKGAAKLASRIDSILNTYTLAP